MPSLFFLGSLASLSWLNRSCSHSSRCDCRNNRRGRCSDRRSSCRSSRRGGCRTSRRSSCRSNRRSSYIIVAAVALVVLLGATSGTAASRSNSSRSNSSRSDPTHQAAYRQCLQSCRLQIIAIVLYLQNRGFG
jgi:hypothetical protein